MDSTVAVLSRPSTSLSNVGSRRRARPVSAHRSDSGRADIDLHRGEWVIPAADAKNGVAHWVPLNQDAVTALTGLKTWQHERLATINEGRKKKRWPKEFSEWVFPSPRGDDTPFDWEQKLTKRIRQKSGIDFRLHDIRRTVATMLTKHCKRQQDRQNVKPFAMD
jgi:integrase